jgi:hypothetical protein
MADNERTPDPFDRVYSKDANRAVDGNQNPPSRERWDEIVLFLLMSKDPQRVARYRIVESHASESLGADAHELWSKMPNYMPNKVAQVRTRSELRAYEAAHLGSMQRLMEARGLGERYKLMITEQEEYARLRREKARRGQTSVIVMGCVGIGAILIMMLIVFFIILFQLLSR